MTELKTSLRKSHNTTTGPDEIPYEFLKQLPKISLQYLLQIFTNIWHSGNIPSSWKQATMIPIPKFAKNTTNPTNYRPKALTSCICKTLEQMINNKLTWFLEKNKLITNLQTDFIKARSTIDHLIRSETLIRESFAKKEHMTAIFFYIKKAYDTTWKYGIIKDLENIGLKGKLPIFIKNFLNNRKFQVWIGTTLSELQEQEMGVPQGSILSVTLFNIKINNIVKCLNLGVEGSLYVDDFLICCKSKYIRTIECQLQQCLNKISNWTIKNGFNFSKTKCNVYISATSTKCITTLFLN